MINEDYTIVRLNANNLQDLIPLYKSAFKRTFSLQYLRQKFETKQFGASFLGYIAYAKDNTAAAYYGVFPCLASFNGQNILCAQSGDTMTHPNHQGKGLFTILAKQTYQTAKEEGIRFVFGFPNHNSYPGFVKKLGWAHTENVRLFQIPVSTFPLAKIPGRFPLFRYLYNPYRNIILKLQRQAHYFQNSIIVSGQSGVLHDEQFFQYKSYETNFLIRIDNTQLWLNVHNSLNIGDIEYSSNLDIDKLIENLKNIAFWLGTPTITFQTTENTWLDTLLSKKISPNEGIYMGYVDFDSGLPLHEFRCHYADADTF